MSTPTDEPRGSEPRKRVPARVLLLGALIVASLTACLVAYLKGWLRPEWLREVATRAGSWGMLAFVVADAVLELLWLPRAWGLLVSGVLFGPLWGFALTIAADMISALICYVIARRAGREWAEQLLTRHTRLRVVVELLAVRRGGLTVALLRCCPLAHYTAVSYAAGLAGVSPRAFTIGNFIGLIPAAVLYPLFGDSALKPGSPLFWVMIVVVGAAVVISVVVGRKVWQTAQTVAAEQGHTTQRAAAEQGAD